MKYCLAIALLSAGLLIGQTPYSTQIEPSMVQQQIPANRGAVALWQSLKKLHTRASLIMITAHPDDEDGGMLTYESRGKGTRVSLLTLNRGEGGANVMSADYFDALGLVRTQELLAAGRFYGVDQYWTRVVDYGFSKTMDESIAHWTRNRVLYDVVRIVRMVRPLVVTSVFVGGPSDGHGNHQTAGAMAQEVLKAAGDPNVFPDQIRDGLRPWSPVKEYARVPFEPARAKEMEANVTVPEGTYDPLLGASYIQISREGLGQQKTQNGGPVIPKPGPFDSPYHRFASKVEVPAKESGFFDGIDVSLAGIATLAHEGDREFLRSGLRQIEAAVEQATVHFSAEHPERCAKDLAAGLGKTIQLIAAVEKSSLTTDSKYNVLHELKIKRVQFNNALAESLGLSVVAAVSPEKEPDPRFAAYTGDAETFQAAIPGQSFDVGVRIVNQSAVPVRLERVSVVSTHGPAWDVKAPPIPAGEMAQNRDVNLKFVVNVPGDAPYTKPYFSRPDLEQSYYDILEPKYLNQPLVPYPLAAWAEFTYEGVPVRLGQSVQTVKTVNGWGSVHQPLVVGPAISVSISPARGVVPLDAKSFPLEAIVRSNEKGTAKGTVHLELPEGWVSEPSAVSFEMAHERDSRIVTFTVKPRQLSEKVYTVTAVAEFGGRQYREGYTTVGYEGLPPYFLYRPSTYRTTGTDVKVAPGLRIGYITGSGDEVPASLENIGVHVSFIAPADLATGNLSGFDAIVLGVRTYAARQELAAYNNRLLDYVKNGGVVIVQYNTPEFDHNFGPYPYTMTAEPEEVTDEYSKVTILVPANPLFHWPNRITEKDFDNWVEERGSKWMKSWDSRYEALLETHDPGQEPQKGGLLYARYGKGVYIYNAYAFYRQLPEGVPGAFRLFANMISLGKNRELR